jgi:hypothetical protein
MSTFRGYIVEQSEATKEAIYLGLRYMGFGRWGNKGKVTHTTVDGRLVKVSRKRKPLKTTSRLIKPTRSHKAAVNKDNTLVWLPGLLQSDWLDIGEKIKNKDSCMAAVVATSAAHQLDMPVEKFIGAYKNNTKKNNINILANVITRLEDHVPGLKLHLHDYDVGGVEDMLHKGIPSMLIFASEPSPIMSYITKKEKQKSWDGIVDVPEKDLAGWTWDPRKLNHAVTVIGYDRATDMLICRDVSSKYNKSGYMKVPKKLAEKHMKLFTVIAEKQ